MEKRFFPLLLLLMVLCSGFTFNKLQTDIVGKWDNYDKSESLEFFSDNSGLITGKNNVSFNYKVLEDK